VFSLDFVAGTLQLLPQRMEEEDDIVHSGARCLGACGYLRNGIAFLGLAIYAVVPLLLPQRVKQNAAT